MFLTNQLFSQDLNVEKGFVIIQSSKDYDSALETVKDARKKLNLKIDLRGYKPHKDEGLYTDIECGCGSTHDYVARGHSDDGKYISIEYSNMYQGFSEGYYIVVIASERKDGDVLKESLKLARKFYPDSYIKNTSVYIGCMH